MQELLVTTFTFGTAIFIFLSMLEIPVYPLIFGGRRNSIAEDALRFVHRNLRFMTSKLPASNGLVILSALALMIWQGSQRSWDSSAIGLLIFYIAGLFVIVVVLENPKTVFSIRRNDSDSADIELIIEDLHRVGRDHHIGLGLNLISLITQLLIIWS
ncbi:MAG: hypothetical protein RL570_472 [Actinomycetota bacterium]